MNTPPAAPKHLGIMLTSRCTARCGHCLYLCSPDRRETLERNDLDGCIRDLDDLGFERPSIHLSGGEPFLVFPTLMHAAKTVLSAGYRLDFVETAGGWFKSSREAAERLLTLRSVGVEHLLISVGPFHQAFIAPQRARRFLRLCAGVFGPGALIVNNLELLEDVERVSPSEKVSFETVIATLGVDYMMRRISEQVLPLNPGGRAPETLKPYLPLRPVEELREDCGSRLLQSGSWHLDPSRRIHTGYCGGLSYPIPDGLAAWYREFELSRWPISRVLVSEGLQGIVELARSEAGFEPDPRGYVSACHACQDARLKLWKLRQYPELGPDGFYTELQREKQQQGSVQGGLEGVSQREGGGAA